MIGYLYIDNDNNLNIRSASFIEVEDPGFWARNSHLITLVWKFDTENKETMFSILSTLRNKQFTNRQVIDFCKAIDFDLEAFKRQYANPIL